MAAPVDSWKNVVALTASDSTVYDPPYRGLLCLTTGNANIVTTGGQTVLLSAIAANAIIPISIKQLKATSTTGTWAGLN